MKKSDWGFGFGSKADKVEPLDIGKLNEGFMKESITVAQEANKETFAEWAIGALKATGEFLIENDEIFIIVCMVGMIIVIMGKADLGKKITSGGFIGYIIAKVVQEL